MTARILVFAGDGIGPEVCAEACRVLEWLNQHRGGDFEIQHALAGGCSIDRHGTPLTEEAAHQALEADAVLLGAVGGPAWDGLPFDQKPERGLLRLRKDLDLFANLRPAQLFDAMIDESSLKPDLVRGLDLMIVRELTAGVYFGTPRGIETLPDGTRRGINTQSYTEHEIERAARVAFELARLRNRRVCSVEKANVMESGVLWREVVTALHRDAFSDIELSHMYADNCAMQLVRAPGQFDVIVTDNLFGDLLSDCAAMLTGSLGMLPSASLGQRRPDGRQPGLYEPVHGSAPDIAGQGKANPLAMILSLAMMLRYSFRMTAQADQITGAVQTVLGNGLRTADIAGPDSTPVSTRAMGDAVLEQLARN